ITAYITIALTLHVILKLFKRRHAVSLGPIPAFHYLIMSLISGAAELRDTR
ncbi:hypothetical protein RYX36_022872, partial [Vicia faba]